MRNLLIVALVTLLSACGFQLRGTGEDMQFALRELDVSARNAYGESVTQLQALLQDYGVNVHPGAPYRLILVNEQEKRRTASYSSGVRSAEYEITMTLDYQIRSATDLLLNRGTIEVQNYYVQDNNNLIGSDMQARQIRQELRQDMIQQLAQRLQLITPEQLDALQQQEEARIKAEIERSEQNREPQQSPIVQP